MKVKHLATILLYFILQLISYDWLR